MAETAHSRTQLKGDAMGSLTPMVTYSQEHTPRDFGHLITLRASAINDCKACITTHRRDAREDGWDEERILHAEDWTNHPDSFDSDEQLVLRLTDAITHIDGYASVPDELWDAAEERFGTQGTHDILVSICAINVFNRVSIATRTDPERIKGATEFDLDFA